VFVWKQNYILVDEYFFFCCTWIVNSADKLRSGINSRRKAEKTPLNAAFWIVCCFLPDAA
ncbi:hypothetical protein, partial [Escherichia coli]|uniref:hypothetical protein n=1 Tax=Escherichia coli TaxID=562 RepID=UPI001BC904A6